MPIACHCPSPRRLTSHAGGASTRPGHRPRHEAGQDHLDVRIEPPATEVVEEATARVPGDLGGLTGMVDHPATDLREIAQVPPDGHICHLVFINVWVCFEMR